MKSIFNRLTMNGRFFSSVNTIVLTVTTLLFASCAKESLIQPNFPNASNSLISTVQIHEAKEIATAYNACGMNMNVVFAPPYATSNLYTFAYTVGGQQKKFGIVGTGGQMNFITYDKFSFEFAGYLDSPKATVKSWKIRRTDGKYLTKGLTYSAKIIGAKEVDQIFLISNLGNNQYKILLPLLSPCNIAAVWNDIDLGYRIANFTYTDLKLAGKDTNIGMTIIPLKTN